MAKPYIHYEWNDQVFRDILNSSECSDACFEAASRVAAAANAIPGAVGFEARRTRSDIKGGRAAAEVTVAANKTHEKNWRAKTAREGAYTRLMEAIHACRS